jgi:hypothetical protein
MTKTKALIIAAAVLGSASAASAQSLIGDGLPSESYYNAPSPAAGYAPVQRTPARHTRATHRSNADTAQ